MSSHFVPTQRVIENSKKNSKNFQKIKKPCHGFFSSQNSLKKAEKDRKLKLSFRFVPTRRTIENSKNIQKIQKYHYGYISSQNRLEKAEKERK